MIAALLLAGCGGGKPAPRVQAAPPLPAGSTVLLARGPADGLLVALACWDAKAEQLWTGDGCLLRMPLGAAVAVLGSGGTAASATAERTPLTVCQSDGTQNVNVLRASGVVDRGDVAVWPAAAAVARRAPVDPEWETSEAEDSALVDAVAAADATVAGEMVIQQAFRVDLDGDRQPDKLYVVAVDDDTAAIPRRFSGLLVAWGAGKPRVLAAHGGTPGLEHRISALSDLDGDGKRELVIDERWNDGYDLALWRVTPARALERVSGFGCDR